MKKKFLSLFSLCLICLLGVTNQVWGGNTVTSTFGSTGTHKGYSTSKNTATKDGITWTLGGDYASSYVSNDAGFLHVGSGSKAIATVSLSTSNISGTITSITVNAKNSSSTTTALTVKVGDTDFKNDGNTSVNLSTTAKNYTFTGSSTGQIVVTASQSSAKKGIYIASIEVTYTPSAEPSVSITGAPSGIVIKGESVTLTASPSNLTPTGYQWYSNTEDDNTTGSEIGGATSSTYSPSTATVGTTYYYVKATDGTNNATSSTVAVVVENSIANTAETAYTTAEAIALINAGSSQLTTTDVYVKGKVSKVDGIVDGAITYWLDNNAFEVYKGKGLSGVSFTATTDIAVGADVIIYGKIKKYNSTYEFESGNYLASYTAPAKPTPTITASYKSKLYTTDEPDEYTVTFTGNGTLSVTSSETGVATASISGTTVTVTPVGVGTTTITISAPETAEYYAANLEYTLTVEEYVPSFTLDLSKDQTNLASEDALVWNNIVTTDVAKGSATTATNNYYPGTSDKSYSSTRFYAGSVLTFTPASGITISSIICTATSDSYATQLKNSTWNNASASISSENSKVVEITPTDGTNPVYATIGATCGFTSIEIKYNGTATYTKNLSTTGYASFSAPCNVMLPANTYAYKASVSDSKVVLTKVEGVIPANTGVILQNTSKPSSITLTATTAEGADYTGNDLIASSSQPKVPATGTFYCLSASKAEFVLLTNGITLGANKAYLAAPSSAKSLEIEFADATGIQLINDNNNDNDNIYNLKGMKVDANYKGIVIKNGKKYLNK